MRDGSARDAAVERAGRKGGRASESGFRSVACAAALAVLAVACGGGSSPVSGAEPPPPPPAPYDRPEYQAISETGIYENVGDHAVARGFTPFTPSHPLFSDGAEKHRFIGLPPGTVIDTSDMNHWTFPIGTRLVKEFRLDGTLLETRLIERYGEGPDDFFFGAFVWSRDGSDAELAPDGESDVLDTPHDVPSQKQCKACHNGEAGRVLGFSALQLGREATDANDLTLEKLGALKKLSDAPESAVFAAPGDAVTARAFGYLHGNCGHCHNLHGTSWPDTQMVLRLDVEETVAEDTALFQTLVGQKAQYFRDEGIDERVAPGDPDASAVIVRMRARGSDMQMPPLATEIPDDDGIAAVSDWILSLAP